MKTFKKKSKIIGWDDGPFQFSQQVPVPIIGVVMRGGQSVEGILKTEIEVDGIKATRCLAEATEKSKHKEEIRLSVLKGITLGGFNVVDLQKLSRLTETPVLAVSRKKPDLESIKNAVYNLAHSKQRWKAIINAGEIHSTSIRDSIIYYQTANLSNQHAERAIAITTTRSNLPEPVRLADKIATAVVKGEG